MKSLILAFSLTLSLLCSPLLLAASKKGVDITVKLTAGSFQITSSKIKGKLRKQGKKYVSKKISIEVRSLDSGMKLRNTHIREKLITKKKKKITVTNISAKNAKGEAYIEIKGIKKPFKFKYSVSGKILHATFKLSLKKFKIKGLTFMGIGAKDIVTIKARIPIK